MIVRIVPFLFALVAFFLWHTPLRGPLTEAEVDAYLANGAQGAQTDWVRARAFEEFLRNDDGRPFVMINLMEVRETADYPDKVQATGAEASASYGQAVLPLLLSRGSYPVATAKRSHTIINSLGASAGSYDVVAVVRYRSRRDLLDMISSDEFRAAEVHKWASLENTLVTPGQRLLSLNAIGYLPIFILLGVGVIGVRHMLARSRSDAP